MKILVTGAEGFLGKNLSARLREEKKFKILSFDLGTEKEKLADYARQADFVFHLAGVNRPKDDGEFMAGNLGFTEELLRLLSEGKNAPPVVLSSSIQARLGNPYGKSKKAAEEVLMKYPGTAYIYRLVNLFGKWSRPGYNTVVATFCYNIARDMEIRVDDPDSLLSLSYVDDVVDEFMRALAGKPLREGNYCGVNEKYEVSVGALAGLIRGFRESRDTLTVPDLSDGFTRKLYGTYLSFLPEEGFSYPLKMNRGGSGSFTEFLRTPDRGQVSVNVQKPGVTKGNHYHHTKTENFLVVRGSALIKFRRVDSKKVFEYRPVSEKLEAVQIPPGYTHSIKNIGQGELVTVMWASEAYDPEKPDTHDMEP